MDDTVNPKKWTKDGFIEHLVEFDKRMTDRALAFIVGSGASLPSGIKTGSQLVDRWLKELHHREDFDKRSLEEWAVGENLGIKDFEFSRAAEYYPQIFQRRFGHDREEGFAFLEEIMENKEPSLGYSILAEILSNTRHKVVVTTNFDNLVADALAIHAREHPLVCGHESLAGFIRPNLRRPLVAKIHRDLFLAPKNDPDGVDCLEDGWATALTRLFGYYTPIVIGYGGNDGSLMGFLENVQLRGGLLWCYRAADGEPSERIRKLVAMKGGRLIPIIGFDEFMLELGDRIIPGFDITEIGSRIENLGKGRAKRYREEAEKLQERIDKAGGEQQKELQPARRALQATSDQPRDWWGWELKARSEADPLKREEVYREGLKLFEESAELTSNFAAFMYVIQKNYDEAERFYNKALKLDPTNASINGNLALLMDIVRKDYDEAERLYRKALELDPTLPNCTSNFALFMKNIRKDYDEAERLYRKALELDPTDVNHTGNFALFMEDIRKDYDEAERLYRKAFELDPTNAINTGNLAVFLENIRKDYDEAERLYNKALELDPTNANNTANYAGLMLVRGRWDELTRYVYQAESLLGSEPTQAVAEFLFYRALLAVKRGEDTALLSRIKDLLTQGFVRGNWSFDRHLEAAKPFLDEAAMKFYRALGDAILDETKLADLEAFPEWREI
jgi:tetratricopeptide (TPR) repeat protein